MNRIARSLIATVTGLALGFGAVVVGTPAAVADTPNYVSKAEFNKIHKGRPMRQVHRIFDVKGKVIAATDVNGKRDPAFQLREYPTKLKSGNVTVQYKKVNGTWTVAYKSVYWGWNPAAVAGTRGSVTKAEFNKVAKAMTAQGVPMKDVHRIFGTTGVQISYGDANPAAKIPSHRPAFQSRAYRKVNGNAKAGDVLHVDYQKVNGIWRVSHLPPWS